MYFKIAIGNVRKSFKDYTIYFLTITLAVCIFYSFNSLDSQRSIFELNSKKIESINMLTKVMSYLSVFVSFILGSLILYASNYLIKKRKKELGIYRILGMVKGKVARILVIENLIVGTLSLISGLILGLILSQGLSVFTGKLFEADISRFGFVISFIAMIKTILYFGAIYLLVIIFNVIIIFRSRIIELLTSGSKNENVIIKGKIIYIITFIISIICIGSAYNMILKVTIETGNVLFFKSIIFGAIGTLLFFYSLSGFTLQVIKTVKGVYFKDLNIFVVKQINSKLNTNFMSITLICLMLFLTMSILPSGLSIKEGLEKSIDKATPFDATARAYGGKNGEMVTAEEILKNVGFAFQSGEKYASFTEYQANENINAALGIDSKDNTRLKGFGQREIKVIKLSEYNKIRALQNKVLINLKDDEVIVLSTLDGIRNEINVLLHKNSRIILNGRDYKLLNNNVISETMYTSDVNDRGFSMVVNDSVTQGLIPIANYINVNYSQNNWEKSERELSEVFQRFLNGEIDSKENGFLLGNTRDSLYGELKENTTIILFIVIYLGMVFLIASMAVLALQQLSEASDSIDRYKALKRIGSNDKMINKTIFVQILIYFMLPISLAFVHSIVGIKVAARLINLYSISVMWNSWLIPIAVFILVYIIYFYATYSGYKNIVKGKM